MAANGNGTHQKSDISDKWLEFFPIMYIATEAAMHKNARTENVFLLMLVLFCIKLLITILVCNSDWKIVRGIHEVQVQVNKEEDLQLAEKTNTG